MSVAWYIVLERNIPGSSQSVNGKAIARAGEMLEALAIDARVTPLMAFFGASPDEVAGFLEDAGIAVGKTLPAESWFSAEEGLTTIQALIREVEKSEIAQKSRLLEDLQEFETVLKRAQENSVKWHLAVDF